MILYRKEILLIPDKMEILCSNPKAQYLAHKPGIDRAIRNVLNSARYILGEQVSSFEKEFARYLGAKFAVGTGNGTEGLHIALKANGIGEGDEVITVSHTAVATVAAIEMCGAVPVLVDIEPDYFTIDCAKIEKAITRKTRAIIPVHIYGQPADMRPILGIARSFGLKVIEDCCQAHGAVYRGRRVGSLADAGCFSFYPTKNLGAIGDGGIITTNSRELAGKCRLLREYGFKKRFISSLPGFNSRLDEIQAAILRIKLKYLEPDNKSRRKIAAVYDKELSGTGLVLPKKRKDATHVYHLYVARSKERDKLKDFLYKKGIFALVHYPLPVHLQPAYKGRIKHAGTLKETERAAREIISLPMYPELRQAELKFIIRAICKA